MTTNLQPTIRPAPCTCTPPWVQQLVHTNRRSEHIAACVMCKKERVSGEPVLGGSIITLCAAKPGRAHVFSVILCLHGECQQTFEKEILENPIRRGFFKWLPGIANVLPPDVLKQTVGDLGQLTGLVCDNKACGNRQTTTSPKMRQCGGCNKVVYCGVECQRQAWTNTGHRLMCKALRGVATPEEMDFLRQNNMLVKVPPPPSLAPAPAPAASQTEPERQPCECFDQFALHRFNAQKNGTCSNLGCSNPIVGATPLSMNVISCSAPNGSGIHMFATHYCCVKCQKSDVKK